METDRVKEEGSVCGRQGFHLRLQTDGRNLMA